MKFFCLIFSFVFVFLTQSLTAALTVDHSLELICLPLLLVLGTWDTMPGATKVFLILYSLIQ